MNKAKRHEGRRIRKRRRREREITAAFAAMSNPAIWLEIVDGMARLSAAAAQLGIASTELATTLEET